MIAPAIAVFTEISPDATGRFRLVGWLRSASTSSASLRKYVPLATRQKQTNAIAVSLAASGSVSTPAAPGAATTSTFLIHCFGRASRSSAIGFPPRRARTPSGAGGAPAPATVAGGCAAA